MSNISKPPPLLVIEDSTEKSTTKRPVSKLTQLKEAPDPAEKKARAKKEKPLSRAERRRLEKEREAEEESLKIVIPGGGVPAPAAVPTPVEEPVVEEAPVEEEPEIPAEEIFTEEEPATVEVQEDDESVREVFFKDENNPTTEETRLAAAHPDLNPTYLAEFAKSDVEKIRAAVAANPSTDVKTLTKLKKDKSEAVIVALIRNENFPAKLLPGLLGRARKEEAILHALAGREDAPPKLAKALLKLLPASE